MKEENLILQMINMQQSLNDATAGKGWESGYAANGKLISWRRCIYMECAELIDSFSWKHWKNVNAKADEENILIEVVDIWHFVLSLMLAQYHLRGLTDPVKLANDIASSRDFNTFCKEPRDIQSENVYEILNDIEKLIHECSGFSFDVFAILHSYFTVALKCGVNLERLFNGYVGKNVLNSFRQKHGYKEGTYIKTWNGKEDNEILSQILAQKIQNIDEIYSELERLYPGK